MITDLGNYYIWAHDKFRETIANLTDEEFNQVDDKVGRSVRDLVVHMIASIEECYTEAENQYEVYLKIPEELKTKSKDDILEFWKTSDENFAKAVEKNANQEFGIMPVGPAKRITVNGLVKLLCWTDHSTFHRGQLLSAIKHLGKKGISSDYYFYILEKNKKDIVLN